MGSGPREARQAEPRKLTRVVEPPGRLGGHLGVTGVPSSIATVPGPGHRRQQTCRSDDPRLDLSWLHHRPVSFPLSHSQTTDRLGQSRRGTSPNPFLAGETEAHRGQGWSRITQLGRQNEPSWATVPSRQLNHHSTPIDPILSSQVPVVQPPQIQATPLPFSSGPRIASSLICFHRLSTGHQSLHLLPATKQQARNLSNKQIYQPDSHNLLCPALAGTLGPIFIPPPPIILHSVPYDHPDLFEEQA